METIGNLTPLQTKVYTELLVASTAASEEDRWRTQRQLVDAVNADQEVGETLSYSEDDYNHCRKLWSVVNAINQSGCVDKIIVTKRYRYKLGTSRDCDEYFAKQRKDALKKLARITFPKRRAMADGQGILTGDDMVMRWLESLLPEAREAIEEEAGKQSSIDVNKKQIGGNSDGN